MADELTDFAAELGASADAAEKAEFADNPLETEPTDSKEPITDEAIPEDEENIEEGEAEPEAGEGFDLGDFGADLDSEAAALETSEVEEGEAEGEEQEVSEDEEEEGVSSEESEGGFDFQAAIKELDGLKVSAVRKAVIKEKLGRKKAEQDLQVAQTKANEAEAETNRLRQDYLDRFSDPTAANIKEHEPYIKINKEYTEFTSRLSRRIKSGATLELLKSNEEALRSKSAELDAALEDGVIDAAKYDQLRGEFETSVEKMFGARQYPTVIDLVDRAADFELKARAIRKDFENDSESKKESWAHERYDKRSAEVDKTLTGLFQLSEKDLKENPFSVEATVHNLLKDSEEGERVQKMAEDDIQLIHRALAGPPPFKRDPTWGPTELAEAQAQYKQEVEKMEKLKSEQIPSLLLRGLWATRLHGRMKKRTAELEGLSKKVRTAPQPRTHKKGKKRSSEPTEEELEAQLNRDLARLGSS